MTAVLKAPEPEARKRVESDCYVEGYALTFDRYPLWEDQASGSTIYEQVERSALDGVDLSDVILQFDHEGFVYARGSNGTLGLETDDHGLLIWADLSKTSRGRQLYEDISSGMVTKMSWRGTALCDFDAVTSTNIVRNVCELYDVSAVSIPANEGTELVARNLKELEKERLKKRIALKLKLERMD